ncbi:MAG TPA: hypothetical protein VFA33_29640 [Bryobacteraceae bacterium]|nr:hypothetical protein [Bryobacteraceae bacterium]
MAKAVVLFWAAAIPLLAQETSAFRVLLGLTDQASQKWDGSVAVRGGKLVSLAPWRFEGEDRIEGARFRAVTHPIRLFGGGRQFTAQGIQQVVANGVIARVSGGSEIVVKTTQGSFSFRPGDLPYGKTLHVLDGRAAVDRIPPSVQVTASPEEEDYPAAARAPDGEIWITYVQFRHNPDHNRLRANMQTPPGDFAAWKAPTGGDQIFAQRYSGGAWGTPIAVTDPGGDRYRTAVAVDGKGRPWVFWAENRGGNFDIWSARIAGGKAESAIQISREAGSDIDPVAATDAQGHVWLAWQGWRNGRAAIFTAVSEGDRFSAPQKTSESDGNEWNPAIAADGSGRVAVAWDSYRNGNYDVFVRLASAPGNWGAEKAIAASARYEAYPSVSFDPQGRLWVAYEEGGAGWGKDFGAYNTSGTALYQGRVIRVRGLDRENRLLALREDPGLVLPGSPSRQVDHLGVQDEAQNLDPDPANAHSREAARPARNSQAARNSLPRLLVDASGRMWLAFRSAHPIWWNPIGTVWTEYVASYDGRAWTAPVFLDHSDNLLDNRPALAPGGDGSLTVIGSSDSRRQFYLSEREEQTAGRRARIPTDPYENDIWANTITLPQGSGGIAALPARAATAEEASSARAERAAVRRMRQYREEAAGNLRIVRGEFHRHSEVSMDGGFDGTLLDQWRYILDAGGLDWVGCCDHDNGGGREYSWWIEQKLTDVFYAPGRFVPMFSYERSVPYPEGHRNVIFARRGIRTLPRLPISKADEPGHAPDTQMLYRYLKAFDGVVASHTSGTNMGTDWRDNDPDVEPAVEIYQGDRQSYEMPDAPRAASEQDSIGGWRPKGFVSLALEKGYRLGFQASSDHVSTHLSYCDIYVRDLTRESVLEALKQRHLYAATDNILADVHSGAHLMGDSFSTAELPSLEVMLEGTSRIARVHVIKDNRYVYLAEPNSRTVSFRWRDEAATPGTTSYYYVRAEQDNGEIVWVSPLWIRYEPRR